MAKEHEEPVDFGVARLRCDVPNRATERIPELRANWAHCPTSVALGVCATEQRTHVKLTECSKEGGRGLRLEGSSWQAGATESTPR